MRGDGRLEIAAGFATAQGPRPDNQDFGAVDLGSASEQGVQGIIAAVADGVGGAMAGRIAAELGVRSFIDGYRAQNPLVGIAVGATRAVTGFNRWLHESGRIDPAMKAAATTLTALILRGREAVVAHVGDSRAWHFRDGVLTLLTQDHVLPQPDLNHVLYRAVGIEPTLRLDIRSQPLEPHDRLLLATDGVHGVLSSKVLARLLGARQSAEADAAAIVEAACEAGTHDNATAILIDILAVTAIDQSSVGAEAERLPLLPLPSVGDTVDGFELGKLLSDGRYTRVFRASGDLGDIVLKFPKPSLLTETGARAAFLRESFLGRRVASPFVGQTLALAPGRQSRLYVAMPFYEGETLESRIERAPLSTTAGLRLSIQVARGVAALHRLGVAHRDIKPDNVLILPDGSCRLIDLGVARIERLTEFDPTETPGTPSFMAPEMFDGERGNAATDQFALGVTFYRLFTGRYPYGEIEAFSRPRFGAPAPASRYRPDLPAWLEATLRCAVAVDPGARFADVDELIHRLEAGSAHAVPTPARRPLIERYPVGFWKGVALFLAIALVASLATR